MSKKGLNIHKRKDNRWEGRIEVGRKPDGAILYRSVYGKTYKEVKERILDLAAEPKVRPPAGNEDMTFKKCLMLWLDNNRIKNKGSTENKYQNLIETHIVPALGEMKINEISAVEINTFLQGKLKKGRLDGKGGLSPSYVRSMMIVIRSAIELAVKEKYREPLVSPILKPRIPKQEIEILSVEAQSILEKTALISDDPTALGVLISLQTGMRIGEVCALTWDDIDFDEKLISVRHTVVRIRETSGKKATKLIIDLPKTKASIRDIPISDSLLQVLQRSKKDSASSFVVSSSSDYVSPRTYYYRYRRLLKAAGIEPVNYHALRHTFATRCIEAGVDIKSLSEILGHSNVSVTLNTYVHSSIELKRVQMEKYFRQMNGL